MRQWSHEKSRNERLMVKAKENVKLKNIYKDPIRSFAYFFWILTLLLLFPLKKYSYVIFTFSSVFPCMMMSSKCFLGEKERRGVNKNEAPITPSRRHPLLRWQKREYYYERGEFVRRKRTVEWRGNGRRKTLIFRGKKNFMDGPGWRIAFTEFFATFAVHIIQIYRKA